MVTFKELNKENNEYLKRFKVQSDQSSIKGSIVSSLLMGVSKSNLLKNNETILKNIKRLMGEGEIILRKKDKKKIIELMNAELSQIKKDIKLIKELKKDISKMFEQLNVFKSNYEGEDSKFNQDEGFLWVSNNSGNIFKLKKLKKALNSLFFEKYIPLMRKIEKLMDIGKTLANYFEGISNISKIKSYLVGDGTNVNDKLIVKDLVLREDWNIDYILNLRENQNKHLKINHFLRNKKLAKYFNKYITQIIQNINDLQSLQIDIETARDSLHGQKQKESVNLSKRLSSIKSLKVMSSPKLNNQENSFRVLILTHQFGEGGGVGTVTKKLSVNFNKRSNIVADVIVHRPIKNHNNLPPYVFYYNGKKSIEFSSITDLFLFLQDFQYNIINIHSLSFSSIFSGGLPQIINLNKFCKVIYTCHSVVMHEKFQQQKNNPWGKIDIEGQDEMMKVSDKIVHLTNYGAIIAHGNWKEVQSAINVKQNSYYPQYRDKSIIIPNGIDLGYDFFKIMKRNLKNKIQKKGEIKLGYLGRLAKEKGVEILAQKFPDLINIYPNLRLVLIGDEVKGTGIKKLMEYYLDGVMANCQFLGWLEGPQKEEALNELDILIVPSFNESFSIVALEAFAKNIPVIISNVDGPRELFVQAETGDLGNHKYAIGIDPHEPESIKRAFQFCLDHPDELKKMVSNARNKIKEVYNWSHVAKQYEDMFFSTFNNQPFESNFKLPYEKVAPIEKEYPSEKRYKVGMFYSQEFWINFIHLLTQREYIVDTYGASFDGDIKKRDLEEFIKSNDIIITCSSSAHVWMKLSDLCKKYKKPHILRYGGGLGLKQDNVSKEKFREALRSANILAPTDLLSSLVLEKIGIPRNRQIIIPNPVNLDEIKDIDHSKLKLRSRFNLPHDKLIIGFLGRMDPMGNNLYLVEAYYHYCKYLKDNKLKNNLSLFLKGKLMKEFKLPSNYIEGVKGNFSEILDKRIKQIIQEFGGTTHVENSDVVEIINKDNFGENNIIYSPISTNIKKQLYLNLMASLDILAILPGFGVGSNREIAEALSLGKRIITLEAVTNPYAYGPVGLFVKSNKSITLDGYHCSIPDINELIKLFIQINNNPHKFGSEFPEGKDYILHTMSSKFLVEKKLVPAIETLIESYNPSTNDFDKTKITKMYNESYEQMKSKYNPENGLNPY